ncbi:hypothetical protein H3T44_04535 [Commensalibacter sp. M0355]|uniref:hypothetical protein n=1 Tax=Commensalibacter TaxID=1079922 RepID=UPI0018C2DA48|nr:MULTISPECIES: hypothetical protein [Commensalibacter]MBI0084732.1 hypothetical protein [Commensalibacter sp. M0355]MCT6843043.1 hypothetical protein [Commensalibacter sp.]
MVARTKRSCRPLLQVRQVSSQLKDLINFLMLNLLLAELSDLDQASMKQWQLNGSRDFQTWILP